MHMDRVEEPDAGFGRAKAPVEIVSADTLVCFSELVRELGGDPLVLLRRARIDPAVLGNSGSFVEYRAMLHLLQYASEELHCPDFGIRLAAKQGGTKAIGPIGVVMKNSKTLGQAVGYCAKNMHVYSQATRVRFEPDRANRRLLIRLEINLASMPDARQAVEHDLLLAHLNIMEITGGAARVRKVLFQHEPLAPLSVYREHFGCDVSFAERADGIVVTEDDLMCAVVDPDSRVYEMATSFIEARYPYTEPPIRARVRALILQRLGDETCSNESIAAELCLHLRTLQRRLRAEGTSFEDIKDEVRRDVALRCIRQSDMSLKRVAEKLGYADTSVLSRSCYRWFSASPRQLRQKLKAQSPTRAQRPVLSS